MEKGYPRATKNSNEADRLMPKEIEFDSVEYDGPVKGDNEIVHEREKEYRTIRSNISDFSKHQVPSVDAGARTSSYFNSFNNVFKSYIGIGMVSIPYAFQRSGLVLSLTFTMLASLVGIYSCYLLIKARNRYR